MVAMFMSAERSGYVPVMMDGHSWSRMDGVWAEQVTI